MMVNMIVYSQWFAVQIRSLAGLSFSKVDSEGQIVLNCWGFESLSLMRVIPFKMNGLVWLCISRNHFTQSLVLAAEPQTFTALETNTLFVTQCHVFDNKAGYSRTKDG